MAKEIEGLRELVAALKALPAEIVGKNGGPLRQALYPAAKLIRDDARARVPVSKDAGEEGKHLRDQIVMKRDPNPRATNNAAERYIVTVKYKARKYKNNRRNRRAGLVGTTYQDFGTYYYWRHLEFGTSKMPPRSFMRAAFEANKGQLTGLFVDKLSKAVAAAVRKVREGSS